MSSSSDPIERRLLKEVLPKEPQTIASKHEDGSDDTSSAEEQGGDDSDPQSSEPDSSDDETEAGSSSDEAENRRTLENLKSPIPDPKFDPKSASRGNELDPDAKSKRIPSNYTMQPILKGSVSSSKRSRNEIDGDLVRKCQRSRIEEKKSVSTLPGGGGLGCNAVDLNEPIAEAKAATANSRAPAAMPKDPILVSFVRVKAQRKLLNTMKSLSACQDPQQREVLQELINQLCCQLGLK